MTRKKSSFSEKLTIALTKESDPSKEDLLDIVFVLR